MARTVPILPDLARYARFTRLECQIWPVVVARWSDLPGLYHSEVHVTVVYDTSGRPHEFNPARVRDSDKLSPLADAEWWGVRNDCNGLFSIHRHKSDAIAEAAEINADCYVVPMVVFYDKGTYCRI